MNAAHLYVHVPFCSRRCSYCDFAIAIRRNVPVNEYINALASEIKTRSLNTQTAELKTIYLGGGTPSRLGESGIASVMQLLRDTANIAPSAEITMEANPEDISEHSVAAWANAGINRLSIGIQSFNDHVLEWMHRVHNAGEALKAADVARSGGIPAFSIDLIFALPDSLNRNWESDLKQALELNADHISLYGLTIEPDTPLGRWAARGDVHEADDEHYQTQFLMAHHMLTTAGYEHYEVSNFARPGKRAVHNSAYWQHVPYLGIGPSAHGFDGTSRRWNIRHYAEWVAATTSGKDPVAGQEQLTKSNMDAETVYLGLRTTDGLELANDDERTRIRAWLEQRWVEVLDTTSDGAPKRIRCTPMGWLRLDALASDLTAIRGRS